MSSPDLVGTSIGSIRLTALLGSGGMGEVYRGYDNLLERQVAVKTIRAEFRPDPSIKARFLREARLLSKLDDPAICKVYDLVEGQTADYLIFELVEGDTLRSLMSKGLTRTRCLELGEKIARALAVAHREKIVHRDLKPENVMVTPEGEIKILDFGISTVLSEATPVTLAALQEAALSHAFLGEPETIPAVGGLDIEKTVPLAGSRPQAPKSGSTRLTRRGSVMGTIRYMSPEQARGEPVQTYGDLYSLGIMLQEMLTGERAYDRVEIAPLLAQVAEADTRPLDDPDPELTRLVSDLKQRRPQLRPDAEQASRRLRHILDAPSRRLQRRARRLAVGGAFALLLLFVGLLWNANRDAEAARRLAETERDRANRQAELAEAVSGFVTGLFQDAGPSALAGKDLSARRLVELGAEKIDQDLQGQPLVRAGVQEVLGNSLAGFGDYE